MIRRARPLLGTLVDITIFDQSAPVTGALESAFARIEQISNRLSFHRIESELSRFNRAKVSDIISISSDFNQVLSCCLEMHRRTCGVFNPAVAPVLQELKILPCFHYDPSPELLPLSEALDLLDENTVRLKQKICLDLGGIAKGYAVDAACEILLSFGVQNALVNAGGDIRAIGTLPQAVSIRNPYHPGQAGCQLTIKNESLATSGSYFIAQDFGSSSASAIVDGRTGNLSLCRDSISIKTPLCMHADALTKTAFFLGDHELIGLLEHYDAEMLVTTSNEQQENLPLDFLSRA